MLQNPPPLPSDERTPSGVFIGAVQVLRGFESDPGWVVSDGSLVRASTCIDDMFDERLHTERYDASPRSLLSDQARSWVEEV